MSHKNIWIIGCGNITSEYLKVFEKKKRSVIVIGRGNKSAKKFQKQYKKEVVVGGLKNFLKTNPSLPNYAIVAVDIENLASVVGELIDFGIKKILCEKPVALDIKDLKKLKNKIATMKVKFFIAYNRRFYESIKISKKIIFKDNGLISVNFEFNEMIKKIEKSKHSKKVKSKWVIANSSHLIDLVFSITGTPKKISSFTFGKKSWHPTSSIFYGYGQSKNGVIITYSSNWDSPGRWGIEFMTKNYKIILKPLENVKILKHKGQIIQLKSEDKNEIDFKPGFYSMIDKFDKDNFDDFCTIDQQIDNLGIYNKIAGYNL